VIDGVNRIKLMRIVNRLWNARKNSGPDDLGMFTIAPAQLKREVRAMRSSFHRMRLRHSQ
jgi:hypothetical protein